MKPFEGPPVPAFVQIDLKRVGRIAFHSHYASPSATESVLILKDMSVMLFGEHKNASPAFWVFLTYFPCAYK